MKRFPMLLALPLVVLAGCGSDDAAPSDDESDKPAAALTCFEEQGIDATRAGDTEIVVGDGPDAPRITFSLTAGESEAAQFKGDGEGAEQIGAALLYVNGGDDDLLEDVENCLAEL
jgi:hypothetical protein